MNARDGWWRRARPRRAESPFCEIGPSRGCRSLRRGPSFGIMAFTVEQHFAGREPVLRNIYEAVVTAARKLGTVEEDPKKTSIHLNRRTAFAGVATRKDAVVLTIKAPADIQSPRIHKHEQASANRRHLDVRLTDPRQVDSELQQWLAAAFGMSARRC